MQCIGNSRRRFLHQSCSHGASWIAFYRLGWDGGGGENYSSLKLCRLYFIILQTLAPIAPVRRVDKTNHVLEAHVGPFRVNFLLTLPG